MSDMCVLISNLVLVGRSEFGFWTCSFIMLVFLMLVFLMSLLYVTNFCTYFFDLFNMKLYS
jgi:hypothetical protein